MKIAIIGHVDNGKSCMTSAITEILKNKGVEVVTVDEKECFDRGITLTSMVKDEALSINLSSI
jgi:translation elongation factor EF-Tu-like GTPase